MGWLATSNIKSNAPTMFRGERFSFTRKVRPAGAGPVTVELKCYVCLSCVLLDLARCRFL